MTDISTQVLEYLHATGKNRFNLIDLTHGQNIHLSDRTAEQVLSELEANGYIEVNSTISKSFHLL